MGSVNLIRGSWVDTTDLSATTRYYPNPTAGDPGATLEQTTECKFSFDCSGGVTLTVEWCGHTGSATTVPATADWVDVTLKCVPITGAAAASYVDTKNSLLVTLPPGRVRVKCVTADATNAVQIFATLQPCDGTGNGAGAIMAPPLPLDAATQTTLAAELLLTGAARTTTAPNVTDATPRRIEIARDGSARVNADIYDFLHQMHLVASTAAQQVAFVRTPPAFPFDGLWVSNEDVAVFGQPRGRPYIIDDGLTFATAAKWTTAGTDWTVAGNKATHVPGAGTDDLIGTMGSALQVGKTYALYLKGTKTAGTSITGYVGTAAGTAVTANGAFEFLQLLVCTGSSSQLIRATADFEGEITAYQIYTRTPRLPALCYAPFALSEVVAVAAGTALTVGLVNTACDVHGIYRRVPGVADLG
jgi:hypothetical protein